MNEFMFGQPVVFSHILMRKHSGMKRAWTPSAVSGLGMIIGKRHLWNGYKDYDAGFLFEKPVFAYIVATGMHTNPYRVLPEHLSDAPPF